MKIDENCINHNTVRLIKEILGNPMEYNDENPMEDHARIQTLGEIYGILAMAETMKEVLSS